MPAFSRCCAMAARAVVGAAMTVSVVCAADIIQTLRNAAVVALNDPAVIVALEHQGAVPSGNTPEAFSQEIRMQYDWARNVVANRNIQLQ